MFIVLYLGCKLIIYSLWCYAGMRLFQSPRLLVAANGSLLNADTTHQTGHASGTAAAMQALGLGFFRLAIGMVFGVIAILAGWIFVSAASNYDRGVMAYVLLLIPVRALEWWITAGIIGKTSASAPGFWWVFGGVVLSCIADIPTGFAVMDSFGGLC